VKKMGKIEGLENTFCQKFGLFLGILGLFGGFLGLNGVCFLSFVYKLTEISTKMAIRLCREKERKWGVKSVDLTEYSISLTDV
jgi:hypothetical protein